MRLLVYQCLRKEIDEICGENGFRGGKKRSVIFKLSHARQIAPANLGSKYPMRWQGMRDRLPDKPEIIDPR